MELGAQRQHCPQATVLFFWTANLYPPPLPPRVSLKQLLWWIYAELSLQQPCKNFVKFRWRNPRYIGALLNLDENPDEFRAWYPASSLDVLWRIQPLICCGIPISTTPPNFSLIRRFKLREPSDEWTNYRIRYLRKYGSDLNSCFFMNLILDNLFRGILF